MGNAEEKPRETQLAEFVKVDSLLGGSIFPCLLFSLIQPEASSSHSLLLHIPDHPAPAHRERTQSPESKPKLASAT